MLGGRGIGWGLDPGLAAARAAGGRRLKMRDKYDVPESSPERLDIN